MSQTETQVSILVRKPNTRDADICEDLNLEVSILVNAHVLQIKFSVAVRPQRPYGLLGTGSPGLPPRLSHSS